MQADLASNSPQPIQADFQKIVAGTNAEVRHAEREGYIVVSRA